MAHLIWKSTYNTGIDIIDAQHMQLLDYLNKLDTARSTANTAMIKTVIDDLSDYTISHFAFEEALMEQAQYSYVNAHKSVHKTFIKRVESFTQRFIEGEDIVEEFYGLLKRWLLNHIQRDDMAYATVVKKHVERLEKEIAADKGNEQKGSWISQAVKKFFR
jgi:hemerythrin